MRAAAVNCNPAASAIRDSGVTRMDGISLYRGIPQPGHYTVRSPRFDEGERPSRIAWRFVASARLQHCTLRQFAVRHLPPERDQQLAGACDGIDPTDASAFDAHQCAERAAQALSG
jgi:hypothetical protein